MIILMVVNWVLYHKVFNVVYFGNAGSHIVAEFGIAFAVAALEVGLFVYFKGVFIAIAIVAAVVLILYKLMKK